VREASTYSDRRFKWHSGHTHHVQPCKGLRTVIYAVNRSLAVDWYFHDR